MMTETGILIGIWAWLFIKKISDPEQAFGWLRGLIYTWIGRRRHWFPQAVWHAMFICPKCHAGQLALWYSVWLYFYQGLFSFQIIVVAIFTATILEDYYVRIKER